MTTVNKQRDLVVNLKRETLQNLGILSKLRPISSELSRQIFKENALEKPTQNIFNHFSYYLVSIIDAQIADKFSWPLYDSKTERAYRNQLSMFISEYSSKGLFSPVMSSYLVNPGCYKVTMLMFQMSQLAVQRLLICEMSKNSQKELYSKVTEKYKTVTEGFIDDVDKEANAISSKFYKFLKKKEVLQKIAATLRERICEMEKTQNSLNIKKYIDDLVDKYVSIHHHSLDETSKSMIQSIKNLNQPSPFFDTWLGYVDESINKMNSKWEEKVTPFLNVCTDCQANTEALIARYTGEADRNSYVVEYNHLTDEICTKELQNQVNTQQKYILKNIIINERLNFPNLIRSFLISISFILKNTEIGDEIYKFNEYLEVNHRSYNKLVTAMKMVNNRVMNADAKILPSQLLYNQSIPLKDFEIPPIPDLSDVKANRDHTTQVLFDTFTPLSSSKYQFNLFRRYNSFRFSKPQATTLITPFHQAPRDNFLNSLISCRVSTYDRHNVSHNFHNISVIPQVLVNNRANETIAECSSGFTKQQIMRLLSTKKSSSSKKFKYKTERPDINIKKGGLFNDSNMIDSNGLFRSFSSPNLYENREKRSSNKLGRRKLSVMREDSPSLLEVSGIAALTDDTLGTPDAGTNLEGSRKLIEATNLPAVVTPNEPERKVENILKNIEVDLNKEDECPELKPVLNEQRKSVDIKEESKTETPKTNAQLVRKTSSLEKIINRFKKVRANVLPCDANEESDFKTIVEEKENLNSVNVDVFTANRILLPDLLSPSCSALSIQSTDYLDQLCIEMDEKESRKPRQSLGTALGVDNTFLDQFDLID